VNWKAQLGIGLLIVAVAVAGVWLWRDSYWRGKIASTPVQRDTTVQVRVDTVRVAVIHADTVFVRRVDSTATTPRWWIAIADTTVDSAKIHVEYNSPMPLSSRGFFSDIAIQLPDRIDSVRTVYVAERVTFVEERIAWEWVAGSLAVGVIAGSLLAR
jgi:hypothetical protein